MQLFSSGGAHKGCKYYQGLIHNTYLGGNIETAHHVMCLMPEDVANNVWSTKFTAPVSGTLR